jgi:FkbM family methyltransferase
MINRFSSAAENEAAMALPDLKKAARVHIPQDRYRMALIAQAVIILFLMLRCQHKEDHPTATAGVQSLSSKESNAFSAAANGVGGAIGSLGLKTVAAIKQSAKFPCNYIHDGFYLKESNELLHQVYQTVFEDLDVDQIPVVIEVGGHDGITKSLSLKASTCLGVNTMLIEASPKNYGILSKSRAYDRTINAALCEVGFVEIQDMELNSGQTKVLETKDGGSGSSKVRCTSIDQELDVLKDSLPKQYQDKLVLAFLVLDVEGHEAIAMRGIEKYSPNKMMVEVDKFLPEEKLLLAKFEKRHRLVGKDCSYADVCYNFTETGNYSPAVFYAARKNIPENTHVTAKVTSAYYFYGQ